MTLNMTEIPNLSREFLHACQSGNLSRVETLVSKCNVQDWTVFRHSTSGDTPLHVAAREGHVDIVRYLCEDFERPEFRVDVANKDMKRPLHEAAQFGRSNVLKYLIKKGASIDCLKRADWTPLMLACTKIGDEVCECVAALLEVNASPLVRNKDGWTPLLIACRSGDANVVNLLLNHCSESANDQSNNGRCAMHIAAFHGHQHIIELLATLNQNLLNARDSSGSTPLHEAVKRGYSNVVKRMIELGADLSARDNVGQTILHVAALTGHTETVEHILKNNLIDVHCEAMFGVTPLIAARRSNHMDTVDCIIKHGAMK